MTKIKNKYLILFFVFLNSSFSVFAQRREPMGRYYPEGENLGLPSLDLTGKALIAAVILFVIGWIISKANEKPNGQDGSALGGCLMGLGIFCAVPALAWLQTVVASIYVVGIGVLIIIGGLAFAWGKINGK